MMKKKSFTDLTSPNSFWSWWPEITFCVGGLKTFMSTFKLNTRHSFTAGLLALILSLCCSFLSPFSFSNLLVIIFVANALRSFQSSSSSSFYMIKRSSPSGCSASL